MKTWIDLVERKQELIGKTIINHDMGYSFTAELADIELIIDEDGDSKYNETIIKFYLKDAEGANKDFWSTGIGHSSISDLPGMGYPEPHILIHTAYLGKFIILL